MPAPLKPIIYIAFANDLQDPGRRLSGLAQEQANIEAAIRDTPGTNAGEDRLQELLQRWDLIATDDLTPRSLTQPFYSNRVAIFHYGGHASPEALLLQSEDGSNVVASSQTIIPFLREQAASLRLIFLNACSTKQWALDLAAGAGDAFCIIATSCPVQDPVAMRFAHDFYNCLASDATIEEAFDKALHGADVNLTGTARDFGVPEHVTNGLPWALYPPGPSIAKSWRMSTALKDPLLGVPALGPEYKIPARPYVSILGHGKEDAQIFFGRNAEIREIYDWAMHDTATPIMLFYGQSGSGKSSLLRAGVWPRLDNRASIGYFKREEDLSDDLNLGISYTTHIADPEQAATAWLHSDKPIVVLLDQVEEVITHNLTPKEAKGSDPVSAELGRFFDRIIHIFVDPQTGQARVPGSRARLILSFRKEYLAEIRNPLVERIPSLVRDFWLDRLTEQNIVDIIEGPVVRDALRAQYKLALEDGSDQANNFSNYLAGRLYDPLSPVATILELELNRLWDLWHPTDPEKISALEDPQGVYQQELQACRAQKDPLGREQSDAVLCYSRKIYDLVASGDALQQFIDDQTKTIDEPALSKGLELDLLYEHTSSLGTAQRRKLSELRALYQGRVDAADLDRLLVRNKDLQLLADVSEDDEGAAAGSAHAESESATVLSHDTLAPVVRREFALSHSPGQSARRILEDRGRTWANKGRGDLLDAADLRIVRRGLRYMRAPSVDESRLLHASRRRRRQNVAVILATVLAVVGFFYYFAIHEFDTMLSVRLADDAVAAIPNQYDDALLLSAAASLFQKTPAETRDAIIAMEAARPDAVATLFPAKKGPGVPVFSPDGSRLLITSGNTFEMWDPARRQRLWKAVEPAAQAGVFLYAAFSPDGSEFAVDALGKVQVWRSADHQLVLNGLPGTPKELSHLAFSQDGKYLAAAGGCDEVQVWALSADRAPEPLHDLTKAEKSCVHPQIDYLSFDPADSGILAVWSSSGKVWLVNAQTGASLSVIRQPGGNFSGGGRIEFSANGVKLAASTLTGAIDVFDVPARIGIGTINVGERLTSFSFNPDGSRIAAAKSDGAIAVWDADTLSQVKYFADGGSTLDFEAGFSPDLRTAAVQSAAGSVLLLDISRAWGPLPPPGPPLEDSVVKIATSPDGKWIATGSANEYVTLWDAKTLKRVWTFNGQLADHQKYPSSVSGLAFTPDSRTLVFPRVDSLHAPQIGVHRLDVMHLSLLPDLTVVRGKDEITIAGVAAGPEGKIAAVGDSGVLHVWDATGKLLPTSFVGGPGMPEPVVFSPDGKWLAVESRDYQSIALLDAANLDKKPRLLRSDHPLEAEDISFSPGATATSGYLAAGGSHGFWIWNLASGQMTTGSSEHTKEVKFSPDGRLILLQLQNSTVELWDPGAGKLVGNALQTAGPSVENLPGGIAFSADGSRAFAGMWRDTFRVWDWSSFPLGRFDEHAKGWTDVACSVAQRNLSHEEWRRYAGTYVPYIRICKGFAVPAN